MLGLGLVALSVLAAATAPATPHPCYDWIAVGALTKQTYRGVPEATSDALFVDGLFDWQVRVRATLMGRSGPNRLNLRAFAHTELPPSAASRVILFIAYADDETPVLVDWRVLQDEQGDWRRQALHVAQEHGLARCPS